MIAPAVAFWQVILAVHIAAVVVAFGVVFAYPLFSPASTSPPSSTSGTASTSNRRSWW
jgi:hypothetical protein